MRAHSPAEDARTRASLRLTFAAGGHEVSSGRSARLDGAEIRIATVVRRLEWQPALRDYAAVDQSALLRERKCCELQVAGGTAREPQAVEHAREVRSRNPRAIREPKAIARPSASVEDYIALRDGSLDPHRNVIGKDC